MVIVAAFVAGMGGVAAKTRSKVKAPPSRIDKPYLQSDVDLPPEIIERAKQIHRRFLVARTSEAAYCAYVADSVALVEPFGDAFNRADTPEAPPGSDFGGVYEASNSGTFVQDVEGGLRQGLNWKNLSEAAPRNGRALVVAVQALEGDESWGADIEPTSDLGGCEAPKKARPALELLIAAWGEAPPCLRAAFTPFVVAALTSMAEDHCYCAPASEKKSIAAALAANARLVEGLAEIGPPIARKLRVGASQPDAQFRCPGPH